MTERPNICYIFEKLSVQGCQIWHSYVSLMQSVSSLLLPLPHWKTCFCEALTSICSNFWGDHSLDVATSKDRQNDTRCNNFHIVTIVTQWFREVIKKNVFYGQAVRVDPPPPPLTVRVSWFLQNKLTYFDLSYHLIKGEIGPIFSHLLTVRAEGADPPSPPLRSAWP